MAWGGAKVMVVCKITQVRQEFASSMTLPETRAKLEDWIVICRAPLEFREIHAAGVSLVSTMQPGWTAAYFTHAEKR